METTNIVFSLVMLPGLLVVCSQVERRGNRISGPINVLGKGDGIINLLCEVKVGR